MVDTVVALLARIDDPVAAHIGRHAARLTAIDAGRIAHLATDSVDEAIAASFIRPAIGRAAVAVHLVTVVTHLAFGLIEDAVAAGLVRLAVVRAAVAVLDVAIVADLAGRGIQDAVAAGLV